MATITKELLSGSTDGAPIKVVATASPGTAVHVADASAIDEIWLWAVNTSGSSVKLTIQFGGIISPDNDIELTMPAEDGLYPILPGLVLTNTKTVKAFAATGGVLVVGYVNRIA